MVQQEQTCAAGISLKHLAALDGMTTAEAGRLIYGGSPPRTESVVFLGNLIPVRPEDS